MITDHQMLSSIAAAAAAVASVDTVVSDADHIRGWCFK